MGFLMGNLLSNYYWGTYTILMGDYPTTSSFMAYLGWDIGYVFLALLVFEIRFEEEKAFFSPISLLPIPIIVPQFLYYLQFGGIFNNIWQNFWCALIACVSVNSMIFYFKNRKNGARKPHVAILSLHFIIMEYIMWTSSCFAWPSEWLYPYTYASYLMTTVFLLISWAISKDLDQPWRRAKGTPVRQSQAVLRPLYILTLAVFSFGGFFLALWMKEEMIAQLGEEDGIVLYPIIALVLFVISIVVIIFTVAVIFIFTYGQRAAESKMLRIEKTNAEHANAAKSDFLANMSHEIRTPINAVLGMNEMILRESLQAREIPREDTLAMNRVLTNISTYSGNIESAGNNLLSIINDILDFSKIEAGKLEIVNDNYRLSTVLNDICIMVGIRAKEKKLSFDTAIDGSLPENLFGDAVRVQQIVTNILNNAVKYTHEGSVRLSVYKNDEATIEAGKNIDIIFEVKDTGIGIRKEDIDKLFDKFERVDLQQNSTVEGTGLGLAITHNLLEMMGGSVSVDSDYGKGSVFTVVIPQQVVSAEPMGDFRNKYRNEQMSAPVLRESFEAPEAVILVVDDTAMNLKVVEGLLKNTKIGLDMASSGAEAIEKASKKSYDIILMDQRMPVMDGTEAMNRIKEETGGPNVGVPFICLTADAVSGAKEKYLSQGFTDYLTKPINRKALEEMLKKYLPQDKIIKA